MTTRKLEDLLGISDEEWDAMAIEKKTLILDELERALEEQGFLVEYDFKHGRPYKTLH